MILKNLDISGKAANIVEKIGNFIETSKEERGVDGVVILFSGYIDSTVITKIALESLGEDFVKLIFQCLQIEPKIEINERDAEFKEIPEQYLDSTLLKESIGWEPKYNLNEGLFKTVGWYVNFFNSLEEK